MFYGNLACRQRYNKYETYQTRFSIEGLCLTPLGGLRGWGQKGHTSTFLEHSQVAYQLKENHKCSNMVANILPAPPPPPPLGMGSVGQNSTFLECGHVAYQIKENQNAANYRELNPTHPQHLNLGMESMGQN